LAPDKDSYHSLVSKKSFCHENIRTSRSEETEVRWIFCVGKDKNRNCYFSLRFSFVSLLFKLRGTELLNKIWIRFYNINQCVC